mmetsp:Transcript_44583/g.51332  ORF Transcript_44583/g.51332 Transcript_44583/m.51332 type:complete len:124 (-) Transcript_44583:543-914(-)
MEASETPSQDKVPLSKSSLNPDQIHQVDNRVPSASVKTLTEDFVKYTITLCNEPSIGIHFIQRHSKQKLPEMWEVNDQMKVVRKNIENTVPDALLSVKETKKISMLRGQWAASMGDMLKDLLE